MRRMRLPRPAHAYRFELLLEFVKRIAYPARLVAHGEELWRYTGGQLLAYQAATDGIVARGAALVGSKQRADSPPIAELSRSVSGTLRLLSVCAKRFRPMADR